MPSSDNISQWLVDNAVVVSAVAASVTAIAAAVATFFAWRGLNTWRDQRSDELRNRILVNFFRIGEIIKEARYPFNRDPFVKSHELRTNVHNHAMQTLALYANEVSE